MAAYESRKCGGVKMEVEIERRQEHSKKHLSIHITANAEVLLFGPKVLEMFADSVMTLLYHYEQESERMKRMASCSEEGRQLLGDSWRK